MKRKCLICGSINIYCKGICRKCYVKEHHKTFYKLNRTRLLEQKREYTSRIEVKKRKKLYDIEYRKINKLTLLECYRKYSKSTNGIAAARRNKLNRRARKNSIIEVFTEKEWKAKRNKFNNRCIKCNKQEQTLDHIYPISKANKEYLIELSNGNYEAFPIVYTIEDIQPLCKSCNSKKGMTI